MNRGRWTIVYGLSSIVRLPMKKLLSRENLLALLFCLILIALVIFTADSSPTWIYQGF
ncbi:MAG: hypothetical protein Q8K73_01860 [Anaerolineales bacterium]|nr:hypothetical protein [Anaerolineales bacterium]